MKVFLLFTSVRVVGKPSFAESPTKMEIIFQLNRLFIWDFYLINNKNNVDNNIFQHVLKSYKNKVKKVFLYKPCN